jgi:glycosyltransferase involved in cell wall biosynthesis
MNNNRLRDYVVCGFFTKLQPFLISKDIAQITYNIGKYFGVDSAIIRYQSDIDDEAFIEMCDYFTPGLRIITLKKRLILGKDVTLPLFFAQNRRYIKVLYFYGFGMHYTYEMHFMAFTYKLFNRNGKLHMRFEADFNHLKKESIIEKQPKLLVRLKQNYYNSINYIGIIGPINRAANLFGTKNNSTIKTQLNGFNERVIQKSIKKVKVFKNRDNIIILTGRLESPEKGLDVFLKSIARIDLKDWIIKLVGGDKEKIQEIVHLALMGNCNEDKVKIHGYVDYKDLYRMLNQSKIYVLSSYSDGMPLAAVEAMACGTVVVSAKHYGMEVALENGALGELFEIGDDIELAKRIKYLIERPLYMEKLHVKSTKKAWSEYSWKTIVENIYSKRE